MRERLEGSQTKSPYFQFIVLSKARIQGRRCHGICAGAESYQVIEIMSVARRQVNSTEKTKP